MFERLAEVFFRGMRDRRSAGEQELQRTRKANERKEMISAASAQSAEMLRRAENTRKGEGIN